MTAAPRQLGVCEALADATAVEGGGGRRVEGCVKSQVTFCRGLFLLPWPGIELGLSEREEKVLSARLAKHTDSHLSQSGVCVESSHIELPQILETGSPRFSTC